MSIDGPQSHTVAPGPPGERAPGAAYVFAVTVTDEAPVAPAGDRTGRPGRPGGAAPWIRTVPYHRSGPVPPSGSRTTVRLRVVRVPPTRAGFRAPVQVSTRAAGLPDRAWALF
ncbi:hypothetical protein GCM10010358_30220 [Streptomyces minutiscleroticus]|uniref:Uncharacterized protein n=1 Tax=Streptomyces minutiscleroticus TaxID=68238 RepID=A0A918KU63_9ACTN|nr:hypothetical protein GCM10010358_30220 [Streptomyces minutiscleroticus]